MRPTRELGSRPILSSGLGGVIGGAGGSDPFDQYVLVTEGGRDAQSDLGDTGTAINVDPTNGNVQAVTLDDDATITLLGPDTTRAGAVTTIELYVTEDGTGGWTPTFAAGAGTIVWPGGVAPTHDTTADSLTRYVFETLDDGSNWYGLMVGSGGSTGAAGGDLSGTYPNPEVVDDSHNHTAATLPAMAAHAHVVSEAHLSNGSATTYTLDQAFEPGSVIAWNTTVLARLGVTETEPDQATVSAAGSSGDTIMFDYAATLV